jgi:hypothetical protein
MFPFLGVILGMVVSFGIFSATAVMAADFLASASTESQKRIILPAREPVLDLSQRKSPSHRTSNDEERSGSLNRMESHLKPSDPDPDTAPAVEKKSYRYLDIEVSHSQHVFKLLGYSMSGQKDILYQCKVGLGGPGFPTPVGQYYVTHIYDDNPWWIPPKDRAWAAGDSPSKRVYGGTMAPLLKKRPLKQKRQVQQKQVKSNTDWEDMISQQIQLDDYGYRFHGTNAPRSIGRNQSHGCVRMIPDDAKQVANLIKDYVGIQDRKESENGTFVILKAPVRLNLIK